MNKATEQAILELLNEQEALINKTLEIPHDYSSIRESMLQMELQQEITALRSMLTGLEDFEDQFKARCAIRETDTQYTISMQAMPESITNQLYWEIALKVFEPKTMKDMLAVVVPGIERHLKADLVYKASVDVYDKQYNVLEASLELLPTLDLFQTQKPTLEQFIQYILSEDLVFIGQDLERFPLVQHAQLCNHLNAEYPAVAKKLYVHNSIMHTLSLDILTLNNKGIMPKVAIEQLIKGLTIGGEKMTGTLYAGKSSTEGVARFAAYFNALPNATKEQLSVLEENGKSLGSIIDKKIAQGECVETTASDLNRLLLHNANQSVLSVSPEIAQHELKTLKDKYGPKQALHTKKDGLFVPVFPTQLIHDVIARIRIKTQEELISLILDFPPSFYDVLWQYVSLDNPYSAMRNLASFLQQGYFNLEQKAALAKALAKVYNIFNLKETVFFWAVQTNELMFLQTALDFYSTQQRLDIIKTPDEQGFVLLDKVASNADLVEFILNIYPQDQRLEALKSSRVQYSLIKNTSTLKVLLHCLSEDQKLILINEIDDKGSTLLFEVADCFESLTLLLELYPENQRLGWIKKPNNNGYTVLHKVVTNHQSLELLLSLYPQEQRLDAIKLKNQRGNDVFSKCVDNPNSLKTVLNLLSDEQKQNAVKDLNGYNFDLLLTAAKTFKSLKLMLNLYPKKEWLNAVKKTSVLYSVLVDDAKSLELIFSIYPEDQRLEAFKEENKHGHKIVHLAANKPGVLKTLLQCLSEGQCQAVFKELDKSANTILHRTNAETLEEIVPFLAQDLLLELIKLPNDRGDTVLHAYANQPHSLKFLLGFFPRELLLDAITRTNNAGNTVLHSACNTSQRAESFRVIMERLPDNQKLHSVMPANNAGYTALNYFADNHELLAEILSFYPEDKRLAAVQKAAKVGAMHRAIVNPKSVKKLLELYPPDQRLRVVQDISFENTMLLSKAAESGRLSSLRAILKLLPEKQQFAAVNTYHAVSRTVLQNAVRNNTSLKEMSAFFSQEQWLALVQLDTEGNMLLHYAAGKAELLEEILLHLPEDKRFDSIKIANYNGETLLHRCVFYNYSQSVEVIFKFLSANQQLELTNIRNNWGNTVLHLVQTPEMVNKLLSLYPNYQRQDALKAINKDGHTVFHSIAYSSSCMNALLAFFTDKEKLDVVNWVDENKNTVLHKGISSESLKIIWQLYTQEQRLEALKAVNDTGGMAFHFIALNLPHHLETVLASLSMHQIGDALKWVDTLGNTVLHKVAENYASLKKILGLYPQEQRLIALQIPNTNGDMALHLAATRTYPLEELLASLSQDQKIEAITIADKYGDTLLHISVSSVSSFEKLLPFVPQDKGFSTITCPAKGCNTLLHKAAAYNPYCVKILLQRFCPFEKRIDAINTVNTEGETVLSYAANRSFDSFIAIQECLTEDQQRDVVRVAYDNGSPLLHYCAAKKPLYLKTLLALYPENQRLNAAKLIDKDGNSLLHLCGKNLENFEAIFSLYPQEEHLEAAKIINRVNLTILQTTANLPKILEMLLNFYPDDQRLDAVMRVSTQNDALLHWIACNGKFESLQVVLASLPESQRLVAVKQAVLQGYTVLHKAVDQPEILKIILALYPQNQRFSALTVAQEGYFETVVNLAKDKPKSLKALLECLSEHQRLQLLKMNLVGPFILDGLYEILSTDDAFHESFVPDYITIMRCLSEQSKLKTNCHGFFHQADDATKLLGAIDECNAFEDIKSLLQVYVVKNGDLLLAQRIKQIVLKTCGNDINLISG